MESAGCIVGEFIQIYQEKLYAYVRFLVYYFHWVSSSCRHFRKYYPTKGPEARLFSACLAAVLFPAGMFIYAWCTFPSVPWIGMAMGIFVRAHSSAQASDSLKLMILDRSS